MISKRLAEVFAKFKEADLYTKAIYNGFLTPTKLIEQIEAVDDNLKNLFNVSNIIVDFEVKIVSRYFLEIDNMKPDLKEDIAELSDLRKRMSMINDAITCLPLGIASQIKAKLEEQDKVIDARIDVLVTKNEDAIKKLIHETFKTEDAIAIEKVLSQYDDFIERKLQKVVQDKMRECLNKFYDPFKTLMEHETLNVLEVSDYLNNKAPKMFKFLQVDNLQKHIPAECKSYKLNVLGFFENIVNYAVATVEKKIQIGSKELLPSDETLKSEKKKLKFTIRDVKEAMSILIKMNVKEK